VVQVVNICTSPDSQNKTDEAVQEREHLWTAIPDPVHGAQGAICCEGYDLKFDTQQLAWTFSSIYFTHGL